MTLQTLVQLPSAWQWVSEVVVARLREVRNGSEEVNEHEGHDNGSHHLVDVQKYAQKYILHNVVFTHYDDQGERIKLNMNCQPKR